jgi:long-chain acyl-CoA synthetase
MNSQQVLTFSVILPQVIEKYAQNNALAFAGEQFITYSQMGKKIESVIAFLEKHSVQPGDKVVIYSPNMPNWGIVYFALQCMGVIVVPVLPEFSSNELQNVVMHSEANVLFISKSLMHRLSDSVRDGLNLIVELESFDLLKSLNKQGIFDESGDAKKKYSTVETDLSVLLYTSGTTGNSKGVMLSQRNVIFNAYQSGKVQPINSDDRFLSVLPLSHTYENTLGLILPILHGASVSYLRKPPTAQVLVPAMQLVRPTLMLTVPMIIEKVYKNSILPGIQAKAITKILHRFKPTRKLIHRLAGKKLYAKFGGSLKFFGIGGAKLDPVVEQFLRDARFPYAIGYGLTETSPLLAGSNPSQTKFQAIGPSVVNCKLKINNPNPLTGEGEIWARGENVMLGYYKNQALTDEVLTADGWFKTGDLGVFDNDGWLSHKGRLKNMIVGANGENIYPEEIESIINNYKHVLESIVIEQKGRLTALVHFNREELEQRFRGMRAGLAQRVDEKFDEVSQKVDETIAELAAELKQYINANVNKFSRIQNLVVQKDPFQKTATQKIKRYLYYQ